MSQGLQSFPGVAGSGALAAQRNRVLRNTYALLALSMVPTVLGAWVGVSTGIITAMGSGLSLILFFAGAFGFMYAIEKTKESGVGVAVLLGFTFFMGLMLSRLVSMVLGFSNGPSLIMTAFAGTGLTPVGTVLFVKDQYVNLLPQQARGIDYALNWSLKGTSLGNFNVQVSAANLLKFYQKPSPAIAELLAARAAGKINAGTTITGGGNLVAQNGRPDWKWNASMTWNLDRFTVGAFTQYVSPIDDTGLLDSAGSPWVIESQLTANLYGEVAFDEGLMSNTKVKVGVRNLTNEQPPLSSNGFLGTVYQPYSRYWYVSVKKSF